MRVYNNTVHAVMHKEQTISYAGATTLLLQAQ
jgi:hypothetical protein